MILTYCGIRASSRHVTRVQIAIRPAITPVNKTTTKKHLSYYRRFLLALGLSAILVGLALGLGILGYHLIAGLGWVDSILNASMILSGMGPVNTLNSDAAKLFASAYALLSGLVFITATGILLAPIFHWVLHRFHLEQGDLR